MFFTFDKNSSSNQNLKRCFHMCDKTVHLVKTEKPQRCLNFARPIGAGSALASRSDSRSFKQENR